MNKRTLLFLGTIVLLSGGLGFFSLTRGHPWWDDFASYLMQAKSILTWTMGDFIQHNSFTVLNSSYPPGPVAYPWGFPLILAPVYAVFGPNPLALKMVSLFFYAFFLISTALLADLPDTGLVPKLQRDGVETLVQVWQATRHGVIDAHFVQHAVAPRCC